MSLQAGSINSLLLMEGQRLKAYTVVIPRLLRKVYATDGTKAGLLRPWQLSWRSDFGVSNMVEPDVAELLVELYLSEGSPGLSGCFG